MLIIRFRSDAAVQGRGFQAHWKAGTRVFYTEKTTRFSFIPVWGVVECPVIRTICQLPELPFTVSKKDRVRLDDTGSQGAAHHFIGTQCPIFNGLAFRLKICNWQGTTRPSSTTETPRLLQCSRRWPPLLPVILNISRLSGNFSNTEHVISTGNNVHLYLLTGNSNRGRGFSLGYKRGCDITMRQSYGNIVSPGNTVVPHPKSTTVSTCPVTSHSPFQCTYTIEMPDSKGDQAFSLTVNRFDLGAHDRLKVVSSLSILNTSPDLRGLLCQGASSPRG